MRILAIDPATQLGWAYINTESKLKATHGSESFHNNKWDGAGMRFHKFNLFLHQYPTVDLIVYEAVENHTSTYAAHAYGGWIAVLQKFGEANEIKYTGVPVQTIKKFWTGKGSAKKDDMIHEARVRGYNPADDNAADALAILHYSMEHLV